MVGYGFVYEWNNMPPTINSLIKAIKKKNEEENNDCQWILLVDELIAETGDDFTILHISEDIDVLIGVSPNSNSFRYDFTLVVPIDKKIIAKRLVFKHRNSLELNVFLAHLNFHFAKESMVTPLSSDEDMPLVDSCFPAIDKVLIVPNPKSFSTYTFFVGLCKKKKSNLDFD